MRVVVWITETTWQACIDHAAAVMRQEDEVALLHVAVGDAEELVALGPARLLGRRPPPPAGACPQAIAQEAALALLSDARKRLGREAQSIARRGRVEREVLRASADADLLVVGRDGEERPGPKSLAPATRFVVDHAACQVLLVWGRRGAQASAVA